MVDQIVGLRCVHVCVITLIHHQQYRRTNYNFQTLHELAWGSCTCMCASGPLPLLHAYTTLFVCFMGVVYMYSNVLKTQATPCIFSPYTFFFAHIHYIYACMHVNCSRTQLWTREYPSIKDSQLNGSIINCSGDCRVVDSDWYDEELAVVLTETNGVFAVKTSTGCVRVCVCM